MKLIFRSVLPLLAFSSSAVAEDTNAMEHRVQEMVTWFGQNDGYLNNKLEIRQADPSDPASYFGVFAKEAIQQNEPLLQIPSEIMIAVAENEGENEEEYYPQLCDLAHVLLEQMELGDQSDFAPYVNYLQQQLLDPLPATWSEPAKNLMRRVVGEIERGATQLPPADMVDFIENEFEQTHCFDDTTTEEGDNDELQQQQQQQLLALVVQRGWDKVLIPIYDMINRSNDPGALNTESMSVDMTDSLHVKARRAIAAGEELYASFNDCHDCSDTPHDRGTPELLRDFGFVESYPRTFYLEEDAGVDFKVDQEEEENGETFLQVTWLGGRPNALAIEYLEEELVRLQDMTHQGIMEGRRELMLEGEYDVIFQFHQALTEAFYAAIKEARFDMSDDEVCFADGTCAATDLPPWFRYKDLDQPIETSDDYYKAIYQSETLVWGVDHHRIVGQARSHYQYIEYAMDTVMKEMCFYLDGIFQICSSYRPQYHEMGVHVPARYLPEGPKRVLWVGGGDAMFLHEILEYPDLELAVGLELDQKVTRGSFEYFGVQPHWDNEKVQWWFGDASKSLLMLPEDYFGSFDMVLVDLSDTVLSLSVTKEMDIIGALSLLLKPSGIFAMNELVR
jgi:spermidine synthase